MLHHIGWLDAQPKTNHNSFFQPGRLTVSDSLPSLFSFLSSCSSFSMRGLSYLAVRPISVCPFILSGRRPPGESKKKKKSLISLISLTVLLFSLLFPRDYCPLDKSAVSSKLTIIATG